MSTQQSKAAALASVQRPTWATRSRICDELLGTIYHSRTAGYGDSVSIELCVADNIDITDDGQVRLTRETPTIELSGGILDLDNAAVLAAKLAEFVDLATGESAARRAQAERILALLTEQDGQAQAVDPGPCPTWCTSAPGHPFDMANGPGSALRLHSRDYLPDHATLVIELSAAETSVIAAIDGAEVSPPVLVIGDAEITTVAELDRVIGRLQAARGDLADAIANRHGAVTS